MSENIANNRFIRIPYGKSVNLSKVNTIRFKNSKSKIYFNLNYSIQIERNSTIIWVSDYVDADISQELRSTISLSDYIAENFFEIQEKPDLVDSTLININNISSVKGEADKLKICINFSNPITFRDGISLNGPKITSEFCYLNFNSVPEYNAALSDMLARLR